MTRDFKNLRKWTDDDEISLDLLMTKLLAFVAIAISASALFLVLNVEPVNADITSATTDNLMSEDMASYTAIYGYGTVFTEGDME